MVPTAPHVLRIAGQETVDEFNVKDQVGSRCRAAAADVIAFVIQFNSTVSSRHVAWTETPNSKP